MRQNAKVVNVVCESKRDFYRKFLEAAKSLIDIRPSAMDVLAELLYWNDKYIMLSKKDRDKIVFNYETKMSIMEELGMTRQVFDNTLTYLRKRDILLGNSISRVYEITFDGNSELIFTFKIKE